MKSVKTIALLLLTLTGFAQTDVLDNYLREGLQNNEALKQQHFQLQKSLYALKEATGLFFPAVNLQANYVDSRGGRTIDIPIGDLMNPVYNNLNQINAVLAPGSPQYPQLENVQEQLNPLNFYNAYFRVAMPLVNAEIWYNRSIQKSKVELQKADEAIYKRELVKEIKVAYFNYLKATQAIKIYENAMGLVRENERVNQKLVENGKEVPFILSRAKAEVSKIEAGLLEAQNNQKNAAAYFNFLLNKPFDSDIAVDPALLSNLQPLPANNPGTATGREELQKLLYAKKINTSVLNLGKSAWIPKIGTQIDLGSQASNFQFNSSTRYYLFGLSFDWSLFAGLRDVYKVKQAQMELHALDAQTKYAQKQLELAAGTAGNTYVSAVKQFNSAADRESTSAEYFRLINKRYNEGQALYIELLDARNESIQAGLEKSIRYFDAWIRAAEKERAEAGYSLQP